MPNSIDQSRFQEGVVITVAGRPAVITSVRHGTVNFAYLNENGRLGHSGWRSQYADDLAIVEGLWAQTVVDLPEDWRQRVVQFTPPKPKSVHDDEWEPETHPSYGRVQVVRTSGHTALFMSPFTHQHYMTLRISHAKRTRSLSNDRMSDVGMADIVEIHLSEAQWARMVSSAGQGEGVPCTLSRIYGTMMENCPEQVEPQRFVEDTKMVVEAAKKALDEAMAKATELVDDKSPSKEKRKAVLAEIARAQRSVTDSLPFIIEQLKERMSVVVEDAKTEVSAFTERTMHEAGLKALYESGAIDLAKSLPGGDK